MAESGIIVCVPEAEPVVGPLRERYDASARLGVPAHITLLYPFMPPDRIDASALERLRTAVSGAGEFNFSLATLGRFPTTVYLEPRPAAPFIALTERLVAEFPEYPPFAGEHPTVIPHLTVAHGIAADPGSVEGELAAVLAAHGPIRATCSSIVLMENSGGRWVHMHVIPLTRRQSDNGRFH